MQQFNRCILHLGTNLGDRSLNLDTSYQLIQENVGRVIAYSCIFETEAWGLTGQPDFYNRCLMVLTQLSPMGVLDNIIAIEEKMGRIRTEKWGPRLIDIDILLYEDQVLHTERLLIPHPFLHLRKFVLAPLNDIAPEVVHPVLGLKVAELLAACEDTLRVEPVEAVKTVV